jgi:histidinol-phosphate/aromatic aminotransferase/cobyric acid decarboxylase-like protein
MKSSIESKIASLKLESGSHSPSISTLLGEIPGLTVNVDACFLSNPYATDLFMMYMDNDLFKTNKFREILEFYPPQVVDIRKNISKFTGIDSSNIFVGNGAIEIIQALLHNFVKTNICVILPTFSSYYEFVKSDVQIYYYPLKKENNFNLDVADYVKFISDNKIKNIALINPNNPNGGYISKQDLNFLMEELSHLDNIILDESFIHFAYESVELFQISSQNLIDKYPNLCIIKSMSKDFGIAGIRAGYGLFEKSKVSSLLANGYLWNVSGLADYFFKIYSTNEFQMEYEVVRKKYIMNTLMFLSELNSIKNLIVYPSKANFALIELKGTSSFDFSLDLLCNHGVYVRDCSDKKGLDGQFIRVASRTFEENLKIISSLKES